MGLAVVALVKNNIYIYIYIMSIIGAANNIGHKLIKEVEIEIGGQKIDKQYSEWLDIWTDLTLPSGKSDGYKQMVDIDNGVESGVTITKTLYIPLQFWFCRNPGLALPLIALQYHEVKVNIVFEDADKCLEVTTTAVVGNTTGLPAEIVSMNNTALWVDYMYLDTDERRRFAQISHEYLIEQLQFSGPIEGKGTTTGLNNQIALNYNHPVKELIWVNKDSSTSTWNTWSGVKNCNLKLNGHDRMAPRDGSYFSLVQPYQHHTNVPCSNNTSKNINVYSFALKPEDHQPSGTCNMSRIDNTVLNIETTEANSIIRVYSINYNVLRIMGGMAGLAYSN